MTPDEEEAFLIEKVLSSRQHLASMKVKAQEIKQNVASYQKFADDCTQALADFYKGNGIKTSECGDYRVTLGQSASVNVKDIESVPEKYVRTKIVKEVNKALIQSENLPESNWLNYEYRDTITIRHKDA